MEDLLEAGIAFFIPTAFALMKSFNAMKEYKKKLTGEVAKGTEFCAAMDGLMETAESAKAAYQKMSQDLANTECNITTLAKRLDTALAAQAITSTAIEKANEEKKVWLDTEGEYVNLLAKKKMLEKRLAGAETEFTSNFYNTKAYANFSAFFASFGQ
ncbi:hypothetical protein Adt_14501 [Abeliophyllum distichum]|uniref:Uncharacterized protein n=1 Tax=Abeliophyllum distichum TaxID=126358 RepID=A0ABD1TZV8_9LAMI